MLSQLFWSDCISDLVRRVSACDALIAAHKNADPDALASLLFFNLLAKEQEKKQLEIALDVNLSLTRRLPSLFNESGHALGMPIVSTVSANRLVFLLDTCLRRTAYLPRDSLDDDALSVVVIGSLDHHKTLETPSGLSLHLPVSSISRPLAQLGLKMFPREHLIWTGKEWKDAAATLVLGIASDAGFTVPDRDIHLWNLTELPHGSAEDVRVMHTLVQICSRPVLEDFERAQLEIFSSIPEYEVIMIGNSFAITDFGQLDGTVCCMTGARVDKYLEENVGLIGMAAIYQNGTTRHLSARMRHPTNNPNGGILHQLTSIICGQRGAIKAMGTIAGGTILDGINLPEVEEVMRVLLKSHIDTNSSTENPSGIQ